MPHPTLLLPALLLIATTVAGQAFEANYDESRVPAYTLPNPLVLEDATRVADVATWRQQRRSEILRLFEVNMYGKMPARSVELRFVARAVEPQALGGLASRREIVIYFTDDDAGPKMDLLLYVPNVRAKPAPVFLGLNFSGNHTIHPDPDITLPTSWVRNNENMGITEHRAAEASRGASARRWPVERILERGYALATAYYRDLDPDFDDGFQNGIHALFYSEDQTQPAPDEWGSMGAWAWGLSRAMDYFETDDDLDHERVAVIGHSRLGKATFWGERRTNGSHW